MPGLLYKNKKTPRLYCFFCCDCSIKPTMHIHMKINFVTPVVTAGFLLTAHAGFSQSIDSIPKRDSFPKKVMAQITDRFPSTRMLHLEYSQLAPYNYTTTPSNAGSPKNKVSNQSMV